MISTVKRLLRLMFRQPRRADGTVRSSVIMVCVTGLFLATGALVGLGYVATREWRSGTTQLLDRRAHEALALVRAALSADMKGAWTTALVPLSAELFDEEPPYSLLQVTARTFARLPYPESFILWKRNGAGEGLTYAFNRADRLPPWDPAPASDDPFPVVLVRQPASLGQVVSAIRKIASPRAPFAVLEMPINGVPYQVVAHILFAPVKPHDVLGFLAFTVNLDWLQSDYFGPLITQVSTIGGNPGGLSIAVTDHDGRVVASTGPEPDGTTGLVTRFPLLFLDPALVRSMPSKGLAIREWNAHVRPIPDSTLFATLQGARRTFILITVAAGASFLALFLTVKADRASVNLASMRSDFVAGVTHELKTPLALIRLVGDTLSDGRYTSTATVQEYARMLSHEAASLGSSIDNLLTYARYSGESELSAISLTAIDPADLMDDALRRCRPTLAHLTFDLEVDIPADLPRVHVDRAAMIQAIDNLIDNAIKYSADQRALVITGRRHGSRVQFTFRDRGTGIPRDELEHVFERFYRGRNTSVGGSGLGLAIAQRIVERHGGRIDISSVVGVGTEVVISLPTVVGEVTANR